MFLSHSKLVYSWWLHQMETFSALLVLCEGTPPVTGFLWCAPEQPLEQTVALSVIWDPWCHCDVTLMLTVVGSPLCCIASPWQAVLHLGHLERCKNRELLAVIEKTCIGLPYWVCLSSHFLCEIQGKKPPGALKSNIPFARTLKDRFLIRGTLLHNDVIKWKHFLRNWPFVRGIHRSPVNSPHKGQWRGTLMFSLICVWINDWVNTREAGDLRRYRPHYDVIVMWGVKF